MSVPMPLSILTLINSYSPCCIFTVYLQANLLQFTEKASGSNSTSSGSGLCAENSSGNAKTSITEAGSYTVLTITALGVMLFSPGRYLGNKNQLEKALQSVLDDKTFQFSSKVCREAREAAVSLLVWVKDAKNQTLVTSFFVTSPKSI